MDLQELIARGRFTFAGATERLRLFGLVDGRKTAKELSKLTKRHVNNIHRDIRQLSDLGLIEEKTKDGEVVLRDGFTIYQKVPLARTIPLSYFTQRTRLPSTRPTKDRVQKQSPSPKQKPLVLPGEMDILDMCKQGEDQSVEFKAAGTDVRKIVREVAAMLNTRGGGFILYGVDDDGTIQGTNVSRQKFDQPLQN
jgi:hypothetical protein